MASQTDRGGLSLPTVVIAILAALGITSSARRAGPPPTSPPAATAHHARKPASGKAESYAHSAVELIEDFLDADSANQLETDKPWSPTGTKLWTGDKDRYPLSDERSRYQLEFLIAILPRPTSIHLASQFDSSLDALEEAANNAGFVLDSFDIPWLEEAQEQPDPLGLGGGVDVSDDENGGRGIVLKSHDDRKRSELEPGLMLFRCVSEKACQKQLLVVFIAGATPTHGIDKEPLRGALDQIAWLSGWQSNHRGDDQSSPRESRFSKRLKSKDYIQQKTADAIGKDVPAVLSQELTVPAQDVRILGPWYSGSACSLRYTLETWLASLPPEIHPGVRVISGTASSINDDLSPHSDTADVTNFSACGLPYAGSQSPSLPIRFQSVRIMDRDIISYVLQDLHQHPIEYRSSSQNGEESNSDTAILTDDTAFGLTEEASGVTHMVFPLHISDLRTAFSKSTPDAGAANAPLARRHLSPIEEGADQVDNPDVVRAFSTRSATNDEQVLDQLLTTIKREHLRFVGVIATDEEDLAFLVHEIRDYSPDVVVFTTSADLSFLRAEVNSDLVGMWVFSAYPLSNQKQNWTWPFDSYDPFQFPNEEAEGIYNATSALLNNPNWMAEYGAPFAIEPTAPVLWVSVVGHDELWPLGYHTISTPKKYLYEPPPATGETKALKTAVDQQRLLALATLGRSLYPPSLDIFFVALSLFSLLLVVSLNPMFLSIRPSGPKWFAMLIEDGAFAFDKRSRRIYLLSFLLGIFAVYSVALSFYLLPWRFEQFSVNMVGAWRFAAYLVAIAIWGALASTLLSSVVRIFIASQNPDANSARSLGPWVILALASGGTVLGLLFAIKLWTGEARFVLFESMRAYYLTDGVSPLLPLIYLGLAALTLLACQLRRVALFEDCLIIPDFLNLSDSSFAGVDGLANEVVDRLARWRLPGAWPITGVVVAVVAYFGVTKVAGANSIEGLRFDVFFISVAFLVYELFAIELLRVVTVWLALKRLLRRLYFHPFRDSFDSLWNKSGEKNHMIILYEPRPTTTAVEYCLGRARQIVAIAKSGRGWLTEDVKNHAAQLEDNISAVEKHLSDQEILEQQSEWQAALIGRAELQAKMAVLAHQVAGLLEPGWRSGGKPVAPLSRSDAGILQQGESFIAGRVVDFLRHVFPQLRSLVFFVMTAVIAMMLATSVYPFPSHDALLWISWAVLLSTISIVIYVFASINANRIISMLSGTTPGVFTWDRAFTSQLFVYGILPILALIGGQLPSGLGGIFSWVNGLVGGGK